MIYGIDNGFLVARAIDDHPSHSGAEYQQTLVLTAGHEFGLTPQVLTEFIHVATDNKRFIRPLNMPAAIDIAENWWIANNVVQVFPTDKTTRQALAWLKQHSLGRKRLLDTLLAATYWEAGITSILTTNPADFQIFGCFQCITP